MKDQLRVIGEHKLLLEGEVKTFQCELLQQLPSQAIVIYRLQQDVQIEGINLLSGTVSYGYFWEDRNYNIYHFVGSSGLTLALYFNISDCTRINEAQIHWRDLVVDILVSPEGSAQVLDEDELPENLPEELLGLTSGVCDQILEQSNELVEEIETRTQGFVSNKKGAC